MGGLSGAALQTIYNNRGKVLEFLGLQHLVTDDNQAKDKARSEAGNSQGDSLGR
jgi:hypothetical protein